MNLVLPPQIAEKLVDALRQAKRREIGGILMGEHIAHNTFRVVDVTIQRKGGAFAAFTRIVSDILAPLRAFFETTKHDYTRFNYLGEWHSHPSFALSPSGRDDMTMKELVAADGFGARFAVLLLVKLGANGDLQTAVTVYIPNADAITGEVHVA